MSNFKISISGSGLVEGTNKRLFVPRLDNKYEQNLYENIEKRTGIKHWNVNQFNNIEQGSHLDAVGQAFDEAMKSAGLYRKINKKLSKKTGVLYFNMYGPTSFMNKEFQVKEMYQSDVFPSFLLNSHNITGYSVRLRSERNGFFQAIELARSLIQSGELDIVIVGGVFQAYSYLYLTEMQALLNWQVKGKLKINKNTEKYKLNESAGFLVIESSDVSEKRKIQAKLDIKELSSFNSFNTDSLFEMPSLNIASNENIDRCYMGLNGRSEISQLESMLLKDLYPGADQVNSYDQWGDFSNINAIKIIHEHINSDVNDSSLLHSIDRDGSAWNLIFK